jgi:CRISPR/Cas system-associated exonuclease Cas4 (RecB family)
MKVICPITHEVMDHPKCLAHAHATRPAECGYDYVLLKKVFENSDRSGIHATDLLGCLRRSYFSKISPSPEYVSDLIIRTLGTLTHAILEDDHDFFQSELPLEFEGVEGRVDLYYPKTGDVVDFKTTRWLDKSKLPYGEHEMQVNVYAWLLANNDGKVNRLFIQYLDMSGPTKCRSCKLPLRMDNGVLACPNCGKAPNNAHLGAALFEVEKKPLKETHDFVMVRRDELLNCLTAKEPPKAETSWLCRYCAHADQCPEGQEFIQKTN